MRSALITGLLGLMLLSSSAKVLADPAFDAVYKMPMEIEWVDSLCPWKSATETGYLRLVRSRDDNRHRLLVQWLRKRTEDAPGEVVSTRFIEELDQQYALRLQTPQVQLHPDHCELTMAAEDVDSERRYQLQLRLKGPGEYRLVVIEKLPGDQ